MKFDFSDRLLIDINNFGKLAFCKKNVKQRNKCCFLEHVLTQYMSLISGKSEKFERSKITIEGVFKFDYKSNDNSILELFAFLTVNLKIHL